jgi:N-acylneuraminate cytidylyltransferase
VFKLLNQKITNLCKKIKLVITDVDGVLTDGGMYYSDKGEIMKKFNTKDGMGVELLLKNNIKTILMTNFNIRQDN